jgi:serpin B
MTIRINLGLAFSAVALFGQIGAAGVRGQNPEAASIGLAASSTGRAIGSEARSHAASQHEVHASRGAFPPGAQLTALVAKDRHAIARRTAPTVESANRFAFDVYQRLRIRDGNLFFSPVSFSVALAMTYAGAAGRTESEMAKAFHFEGSKVDLHRGMGALLASWRVKGKNPGFRLDVANRLWVQQGERFQDAFVRITRVNYGAELGRVDFRDQPEQARRAMNEWVEVRTDKRIKDLAPSAATIKNTRLLLTNAVYFKGDWTYPFDQKRTKEADFHVTADQSTRVPFMHIERDLHYDSIEGLQVVELPYGERSLSMILLLPDRIDGLGELEAKLTASDVERWTTIGATEPVIVDIPRFKATSQFEMTSVLKSMGMVSAFDPSTADFSGMSNDRNLFVSAVIHKAAVEVNEEGTEASAATGVTMSTKAIFAKPRTPAVFRANHPFLFLIRDNRNGSVVFIGRMIKPAP